jgi:uncharacterized membrane protein YeaQ/YmgE (transglycosylase-associated protein family)
MRTGRELVRNDIAEAQHADVCAVHLDEYFTEADVLGRFSADRDARKKIRAPRRPDKPSADFGSRRMGQRNRVPQFEKHDDTSYRIFAVRKLGRRGPYACTCCIGDARSTPDVRSVEEQMAILGWIVFGLIVGALAKLVMPGRDAGGIIVTILLGIAGAVLGGFIGQALGWYGEGEAAGFIVSFFGAVLLLALYRMFTRRRRVIP